jgi:endonuclease YncB( thermonuclease family)
MTQLFTSPFACALVLAGGLIVGCPGPAPATPDAAVDAAVDAAPDPFDHPARVLRVIDGDTIEVEFQSATLRVRFWGVDTPELGPPAEPWADEARLMTLQNATPATTIGLEFDDEACGTVPFPSTCFDLYDRMLAYVRTAQGYDLNAMLLAGGLATVYEPATFDRKASYLALQAEAQAEGLGLWSQ